MDLEQAIITAMDYEARMRDIYRQASQGMNLLVAKDFLETMGDDEQHHLEYLAERLQEWRNTGRLKAQKLETVILTEELMARQMTKFKGEISKKTLGDQKRILSRALKVEVETSNYYRKMVEEMPDEGQRMFARFLHIEERHIHAVQMQLDYVTKTGYWFGFKEFDME
jgi:rubrerythrin